MNRQSRCLVLLVLVTIHWGCARPSASSSTPSVVFDRSVVDLGVLPSGDDDLKLDIGFRVEGGPLVVDSITRSCQCTEVGEGLVGTRLEAGRRYTLPVKIDIRRSPRTNVQIDLNSGGKTVGSVTIRGVLEGNAEPTPRTVRAEFGAPADPPPSGVFEVSRLRSAMSPPLEPAAEQVAGRGVEIRLVGRRQVTEAGSHAAAPGVVTDVLTWSWATVPGSRDYIHEQLLIRWRGATPDPTPVQFLLTQPLLASGRDKEIRCGTLKPSQAWSYTMVLRGSGSLRPDVTEVLPADPFVSAQVKKVSLGLTLLKFSVKAPEKPGEFQTHAIVSFAGSALPPLRIPIVGTVAP